MSMTMTVEWRELRRAAVVATHWGWPVAPGTVLGTDLHWHAREAATARCPIGDTWHSALVTDPDQAQEIWTQHPAGVLLVCGRGVEVVELPHRLAGLLPALATGSPVVPVAVTGLPPRWWLFVATGLGTLSADLALASVRVHSAGAWVALPLLRWRSWSPRGGACHHHWVLSASRCPPPSRCSRSCWTQCCALGCPRG